MARRRSVQARGDGKPIFVNYVAKDMLDGCQMLTAMEELAYRRICDLIYVTGDNVADDETLAWATKTGAEWQAIRTSLLAKGKLDRTRGRISNRRCRVEIAAASVRKLRSKGAAEARHSGTISGQGKSLPDNEKRQSGKAQAPTQAPACDLPSTNHYPIDKKEAGREEPTVRDSNNPPPPLTGGRPPLAMVGLEIAHDDVEAAFKAWNDLAEECDLSKVQRITDARRKALKLRLTECGGIEGWRDAMAKIRGSPFLLGENDRGWKADFDFVCQPKSFTRLMENTYAGKPGGKGGGSLTSALDAVVRKHGG